MVKLTFVSRSIHFGLYVWICIKMVDLCNGETILASILSFINKPWHGISNNVVFATSKASDQPAHTRSLIRTFASRLSIL